MKELTNRVTVTGKLVKNNIEEFEHEGVEKIGGSLILRTADMSEHEINFSTTKYKKDEGGNFTNEETYFYKQYKDACENLKDIEHCQESENPDIISITDASFSANDFKDKSTGNIITTNKLYARFINRVEPKDYESTILEGKFEVEGIIESIKDEVVKEVPTGNLIVNLLAIRQNQKDYKDSNSYEADSLTPIKLIVDKDMTMAFRSAGYYEGGFAKFVGSVINTVEITKQVEKAAFGTDIEKEVKRTIKKNLIKSGTAVSTIFEHELTQEVVDALKAKRKAKLAEIKAGVAKSSEVAEGFEKNTSTPAPQTTYNPFAQN